MASFNRAEIIGYLGADPEVRHTQSGDPVCNLRVATSESWTDSQGQAQESTEWHRVVVWGASAEACGQHLRSGSSVFVEGPLKSRKWTDKEGVERYTTEIVARRVVFLDRPAQDEGEPEPPEPEPDQPEQEAPPARPANRLPAPAKGKPAPAPAKGKGRPITKVDLPF
jgi:single-strand DNA-binding protein